MNQWIAIVIVLGLFAIGDVISSATGARISSVFVTLIGFLALFMSGILPGDIMTISGLQGAAAIAGQGLVFHMGTTGYHLHGGCDGIGIRSGPAGWLGCCRSYHSDR